MTIYKTDDYNWYYSNEWDATDRIARGEISITGKKVSPVIVNKGLDIYTIKDISGLTEKELSALGLWHYVETQEGGINMYSGLKINPHRWEPNFYQYPLYLELTPGTIILFTPDGKCHWLKIDLTKRYGNSLEACLMSLYMKIWSNTPPREVITTYEDYRYLISRATDRWLRTRKQMAGMEGKSASTVHKYTHFTFGIDKDCVSISTTIPNKAGHLWTKLKKEILKDNKLSPLWKECLKELRKIIKGVKKASISFSLQQRHAPSGQKLDVDATLDFNIGTYLGGGKIKTQEQWFNAFCELVKGKKSNFEFQIRVEFNHRDNGKNNLLRRDGGKDFIETTREILRTFKPIIKMGEN